MTLHKWFVKINLRRNQKKILYHKRHLLGTFTFQFTINQSICQGIPFHGDPLFLFPWQTLPAWAPVSFLLPAPSWWKQGCALAVEQCEIKHGLYTVCKSEQRSNIERWRSILFSVQLVDTRSWKPISTKHSVMCFDMALNYSTNRWVFHFTNDLYQDFPPQI